MAHTPRIGIQIELDDPFWVQVREVMWQRAQTLAAELVEVNIQTTHLASADQQSEVVEDLIVQELDALISNTYPLSLLSRILERQIPIIYVSEIALRHPCLVSRLGLYDAAYMLGRFLDERLAGHGTLLIVGGESFGEDNGQSRLDGFAAALAGAGLYSIHRLPSDWTYEQTRPRVEAFLSQHPNLHIDAIFGLSDSQALAARDVCQARGRINRQTLILGVNGDPLALAAIAGGSMTATVETDVDDIATQAVALAYRAAQGEPLPEHFRYAQRLITADNVAEVAVRKMLSLATLPTHLLDINRRNEQQRRLQLATGQAIDRQVGLILDEGQLALAITALIRDNYGFDHARFLRWHDDTQQLSEVGGRHAAQPLDPACPLAYALAHDQLVFIPDTLTSHRFAPDPQWPATRSRVVAPVHLGGQIIGLLDLHRQRVAHHTREELGGLQLLADRLGISARNAELYAQEQAARAAAEKADQLKTRLLANVSHELRTPLNVVLGYSSAVLGNPAIYDTALPPALLHDLQQIYSSGEHLIRLINDLLDLSRAEINELDLFPELIEPRAFLSNVFGTMARGAAGGAVEWRAALPDRLPLIQADPVRLRQVLLNLLSNASKFTASGAVELGADVLPPHLHLWVQDTGAGIPIDLQERIFEPFVTSEQSKRRQEGVGLGLSITRRLVALHGGSMSLESQPGRGSTFHVYLPLPSIAMGQAWLVRLHHPRTGVPYGIAMAAAALM
ncbi:MAG TPA: ATP-binding protein, partial [Kouleothrix sp.]|nr:ATP-binding protein [Kouleothrix sp.]